MDFVEFFYKLNNYKNTLISGNNRKNINFLKLIEITLLNYY